MKTEHAIQTLWQHAAPQLPDTVLEHLASAEDSANALRNIAVLMERLGGVMAHADHIQSSTGRHDDLPDVSGLLLGFASAIAMQAEMVDVASDAAALLRQRAEVQGLRRPGLWPGYD